MVRPKDVTEHVDITKLSRHLFPEFSNLSFVGHIHLDAGKISSLVESRLLVSNIAGIRHRFESLCTASYKNDIRTSLVEPDSCGRDGRLFQLTLAKRMAVAFMDEIRNKNECHVD